MNNREEQTRSYYEPRVRTYRKGYEIHDWEDSASQYRRFDVLLNSVELDGASLLDVGCGVGDLYHYLIIDRKMRLEYTGLDLLDAMIERARSRFPAGKFIAADLTSGPLFDPGTFDVVFCSGVFNLRIGDHDKFARTMLPVLVELSRNFLVFNMLHIDSPNKDDQYCYFDPGKVVAWPEIAPLGPRIISGYLPNDFSIVCAKQ